MRYLAALFLLSAGVMSFQAQPATADQQATQLFNRASEQLTAGQNDAAIANFTEYLRLKPNSSAAYYNRGLALYNKAQIAPTEALYRQAAGDLSKAIEIKPNDADYWTLRGMVYNRLVLVDFKPSLAQAIADLTQAIKLNPRHAGAHRERGIVYELSNQLAKALPDLNTAIRLDPKDALAFYTRAKVHGASKRYAAAKKDAETAIRLFPNYEAAKIYLNYMNEQIASSSAAAKTAPRTKPVAKSPVRANPTPKPTPAKPVRAVKPDPAAVAAAIDDLSEAYKQTEAAAKAKDHVLTVALATRTLQLLPMRAELEPKDHLMISVFMNSLEFRGDAYAALGKYADSDKDYKDLLDASNKATIRHMKASNVQLGGEEGSGGGTIMANVEMIFATSACKSGFDKGIKWMDAVQKTRPNDSSARMKAAISVLAIREICAAAFIMYGNNTASEALYLPQQKTKLLNDAIGRYTEAIGFQQSNMRAYQERARAYRQLGRNDLAAADEAKVRELSAAKKN
ncbi:MAG: tetratricopeptide repeat protein [Acidobacteriota bacterium]|nr:MAG: tetratricopeptide repeat protein [Acidobacteriota bacterium]